MSDQSVSVPMSLSDLERRDARGQRRISFITLVPIEVERANSADNTCGVERISRKSATFQP